MKLAKKIPIVITKIVGTAWPMATAESTISSIVTNIHVEMVTGIVMECVLQDSNVAGTILIGTIPWFQITNSAKQVVLKCVC